jgi:hypothetical protein
MSKVLFSIDQAFKPEFGVLVLDCFGCFELEGFELHAEGADTSTPDQGSRYWQPFMGAKNPALSALLNQPSPPLKVFESITIGIGLRIMGGPVGAS